MNKENQKYDENATPVYYTLAMQRSYRVMIVYFLVFMICMLIFRMSKTCLMVLPWLIVTCLADYHIKRIQIRWNLLFFCVICIGWISYFIYLFGWDCGGINFIMPLVIISVFSLYDSLFNKIAFIVFLFLLRMGLFLYWQTHQSVYNPTETQMMILQTVNTSLSFIVMAMICITFSANLQKAEKHLMLYNMELRQQAGTDPLTTLYNRRRMEEIVKNHIAANPSEIFSVAMGDIDLFKSVNDTYGHNCGDQVLKDLSALFKEKTLGLGHVCRWGGEEFFFFFPNMNLDAASALMNDINMAVSKCPIVYQNETHHVTMTFGVEEYDYHSDLTQLVKQADDKLYYGKTHGRNTVIF